MIKNLKLEKKLIKAKFELEHEFNERLYDLGREEFLYSNYPIPLSEPEMTYEEMLALGDQIGTVSKGLGEEQLLKLKRVNLLNDENCSICLHSLEIGTIATILEPCGHIYDSECIKKWLEHNKTCPLCLHEVNIE